MPESLEQLQKDAIASIASVCSLLRNAIATSLPVAPEQYLTIAIPGTVIDLADYEKGGSFVYDVGKHATTPTTVRQSEARLVDSMMPVATIMVRVLRASVRLKAKFISLRSETRARALLAATRVRWMLCSRRRPPCPVPMASEAPETKTTTKL